MSSESKPTRIPLTSWGQTRPVNIPIRRLSRLESLLVRQLKRLISPPARKAFIPLNRVEPFYD